MQSERSSLKFYKKLVELRKRASFQRGSLTFSTVNDNVFSFVRDFETDRPYLVAMNVGIKPLADSYTVDSIDAAVAKGNVVLSSRQRRTTSSEDEGASLMLKAIELRPGDVVVMEI